MQGLLDTQQLFKGRRLFILKEPHRSPPLISEESMRYPYGELERAQTKAPARARVRSIIPASSGERGHDSLLLGIEVAYWDSWVPPEDQPVVVKYAAVYGPEEIEQCWLPANRNQFDTLFKSEPPPSP